MHACPLGPVPRLPAWPSVAEAMPLAMAMITSREGGDGKAADGGQRDWPSVLCITRSVQGPQQLHGCVPRNLWVNPETRFAVGSFGHSRSVKEAFISLTPFAAVANLRPTKRPR